MEITIFWDAAPCNLVEFYWRCRGVWCLRHHRTGDGVSRHACEILLDYTATHLRRQPSRSLKRSRTPAILHDAVHWTLKKEQMKSVKTIEICLLGGVGWFILMNRKLKEGTGEKLRIKYAGTRIETLSKWAKHFKKCLKIKSRSSYLSINRGTEDTSNSRQKDGRRVCNLVTGAGRDVNGVIINSRLYPCMEWKVIKPLNLLKLWI
jgi:hypothetical protein